MAGLKEQAQIEVIINGTKATATIAEMEKAVKILNAQIKQLTPGTQEFVDKTKELQAINARLADVKNSVKGVSTETGKMRDSIISLAPGGGVIQGLQEKFTSATGALKGMATGANLLRLSMLAIPIIAIAAALGSLIVWFKKTDDGARTLDGIIKAVSNTMDVLLNRVLNIGDTLKALFTNPIQFFKDFSKDVVEATEAGIEFANMLDEIDEKERNIDLANSEREKQITRLILQSKNRTLSEADRIKLLEQASKLETESLNENIKLQDEKIRLAQLEADQYAKQFGRNDDLERKLIDAKIKRNQLEQDSLNLQEKIKNREDALLESKTKAQEKANAQREKDQAEADKKLLATQEFIKNATIEIIEDGYKKEKALQNKKFDEDMAAYGDNQNAFNLITEKYKQDTIELDKKYADIKAANDKKAFEKQLEDNQLGFEILYEQAKTNYLEGYLSEEEYQNTLLTLQYSAESQKLELLQNSGRATELEIQQQANKVLQITQNKNAARLANERQTAQAIGTVASTLGGFVNTVMSIGSENYAAMTEQQKIAAGIQIAVNMATGIAGLVAAGASDASSVTWFERVAKVVASAGIVIAGIANATSLLSSAGSAPDANIKDTPSSPSFAYGGFTGSGFGMPDSTGYRPAGIVHEDEWVAPRWMKNSTQYGPVIYQLEQARQMGGYASGGNVPTFSSPTSSGEGMYMRLHPSDIAAIGKQVKGNIQTELNLEYFDQTKAKIELIKKSA